METVVWIVVVAVGIIAGWMACAARARQRASGMIEATSAMPDDGRARATMQAIVDGIPAPALLVGADTRIVHVNARAMRDLSSLQPGLDPGSISASLSEIIRRAFSADQDVTTERVVLGDPPRSLGVTVVPYESGGLVCFEDVTEDVDFEEARRTFSAAVSHELRTPLARILGLAETLALPELEDEREDLVLQIEHEVDGIRKLIDEMLLLAALDRGRLAVADGVVDACGVVRRVAEDARGRRIGRGHEISVDAPGDIEIPVSERLFEVVVENLVDNALIHGGDGAAVNIRITQVGPEAVLEVADTGIGIPSQHLPFVFQRFYRGDASRTGPGSGLGLALVKHIVEAHGGAVIAESDGIAGTAIQVTLPVLD